MSSSRARASRLTSLGLFGLLVAACASPGALAQSNDGTRGLGDLGFVDLRPSAPKSPAPRKKPTYRRTTPAAKPTAQPDATPASGPTAETLVGVTLWRMRPSAKADGEAARILVHEEDTNAEGEWTPERVGLDTALAEGQRVRLSIETPRSGYLYVVDREVYADGSASPAVLIFPTTRTRGGDNKVSAGSVVEIPALTDAPVYFTAKRSRPDHVAESLTVIVAPEPLEGVTIGRNAQTLAADRVAAWEREWGAPAERLELVDGEGATYTTAEKAAGADAGAKLTQGDPVPQTVFRVESKPGDPVLVTFKLKLQ
jgi:hypothetical protein